MTLMKVESLILLTKDLKLDLKATLKSEILIEKHLHFLLSLSGISTRSITRVSFNIKVLVSFSSILF